MLKIVRPMIAIAMVCTAILLGGCGSSSSVEKIPAVAAKAYAEPGFATDAATLHASLGKADLVILDARSQAAYDNGHVPGALHVIWQQFATVATGVPGDANWGVLKTSAEIGTALGNLGIDATKEVVVYADAPNGWGEDGRILWMLRMAGVSSAKLLNGGIKGWVNAGYALATDATAAPAAVPFTIAALDAGYVVDKAWIVANMNRAEVKIIDARAPEEYAGAIKYGEKRGGHIPGAVNLPFNLSLFTNDAANPGIIKGQEQLEATLTAAGIAKTDTIVCYCTKGIRSGLMTVILRMAGYTKAVNYDASFYEWAGDATLPVL